MATHKLINKTDEVLNYTIGRTRIKIPPRGEFLINLKERMHQEKPAMKRWLRLIPHNHADKLEVIDLVKEERVKALDTLYGEEELKEVKDE